MTKSKNNTLENKNTKKKCIFIHFFRNRQPYSPPERYKISTEKLYAGLIFEKIENQFLFDNHLYVTSPSL